MDSIVKKISFAAVGDCEIGCIMIGEEPNHELYFDSIDLCNALGFKSNESRKQALRTHVHHDDKTNFESLLSRVQVYENPNLDGVCHSDKESSQTMVCRSHGGKNIPMGAAVGKVIFVNESGLYSLAFGSKKPFARLFRRWVTSEVLPQIRKTGSFFGNYAYWRNEAELGPTPQKRWSEVKKLSIGREDELHYQVVNHINKQYPDATLNAGLGEHLTTGHARMDARLKGYVGGQPDIIIIRGLPNGFQDVLAIELKNPNKKGKLSSKQVEYIDNLQLNCNVQTIVSCDYDEVVIQMHEHYKEVFARAQLPAIADKRTEYDFSANENPQYWMNKLKNGSALVEQCNVRGIPKDEVMISTKRQIASILITFDKRRKLDFLH